MVPYKLDQLKETVLGKLYTDYRHNTVLDPHQKLITREASRLGIIKRLVFHCTDATGWSPERLSRFFVEERKFPICGYHYYIQPNTIWQMVSENVLTYHAAPFNKDSVSFSIDYAPTQMDKIKVSVDSNVYQNAIYTATYLALKFKITPDMIVGHRELQFTGWFKDKQDHIVLRKECPGLRIDLDVFRHEVARNMQKSLNLLYGSKDIIEDGIFGPKSILALNSIAIID